MRRSDQQKNKNEGEKARNGTGGGGYRKTQNQGESVITSQSDCEPKSNIAQRNNPTVHKTLKCGSRAVWSANVVVQQQEGMPI